MQTQSVLILEDDKDNATALANYISSLDDMSLAGVTDSAPQGLRLVSEKNPDIILLDLELRVGSGLFFLADLQTLKLPYKPAVYIISNNASDETRTLAMDFKVKYFFEKRNTECSPRTIVAMIRMMHRPEKDHRGCPVRPAALPPDASEAEFQKIVARTLARIGIAYSSAASDYFVAAEQMIDDAHRHGLEKPDLMEDILPALSEKFGKTPANIHKRMQYALNTAWTKCKDTHALQEYYPFFVSSHSSAPTVWDFLFNFYLNF